MAQELSNADSMRADALRTESRPPAALGAAKARSPTPTSTSAPPRTTSRASRRPSMPAPSPACRSTGPAMRSRSAHPRLQRRLRPRLKEDSLKLDVQAKQARPPAPAARECTTCSAESTSSRCARRSTARSPALRPVNAASRKTPSCCRLIDLRRSKCRCRSPRAPHATWRSACGPRSAQRQA